MRTDQNRPSGSGTRPRERRDLLVDPAPLASGDVLATLGPAGTSSEAATLWLAKDLGLREPSDRVLLCPSYEAAQQAVLDGEAARLVVANAYSASNRFYMDARLRLERAFVYDTPTYGIAARPGRTLPLRPRVVTHPAPEQLIPRLLPAGYLPERIEHVASTSTAAIRVAEGSADLALTTSPAAHLHDLSFVSPRRAIRMLWSVFARAQSTRRHPA